MNTFTRLALAAGLIGAASPALAQSVVSSAAPRADAAAQSAAIQAYWTPERMANAKPLVPTYAGPRITPRASRLGTVAPQIVRGAGPTVAFDESEVQTLFTPNNKRQSETVTPALNGTTNLPFTTNRLYPAGSSKLNKTYPYQVAGQLFFTINGANYLCSGAVIRARVVATAGHCVADGHGSFYGNWMFVPGLANGVTPLKSWTASYATTTVNWFNGGGTVPNIQDNALLVMNDLTYSRATHRIGDVTGYLGYEYNAALPTHITQIGYPCNLDSCNQPEATNAQDYAGPSNNFVWGTAQSGGSSGGPEIQDFGQAPSGIPSEILGGNILVSVTSFVYTTPGILEEGGSILGAPGQFAGGTFGDLINSVCAGAGNC